MAHDILKNYGVLLSWICGGGRSDFDRLFNICVDQCVAGFRSGGSLALIGIKLPKGSLSP